MSLKLMCITNEPEVAKVLQGYGVERIWVDLETLGKEERQGHVDSVKSRHCISDIQELRAVITTSELLVRVNPINPCSKKEIEDVIRAGADVIMLPMWKTVFEVQEFLRHVQRRVKTVLLLETKEALECIDEVLNIGGFDEIHIGLNDLHLSLGMHFMFELLSDGTVENLCKRFKKYGIPYGFGGVARLGTGLLPAENVIAEHYRLGSTRAILSRSFCDINKERNYKEVFSRELKILRDYEMKLDTLSKEELLRNAQETREKIMMIANQKG